MRDATGSVAQRAQARVGRLRPAAVAAATIVAAAVLCSCSATADLQRAGKANPASTALSSPGAQVAPGSAGPAAPHATRPDRTQTRAAEPGASTTTSTSTTVPPDGWSVVSQGPSGPIAEEKAVTETDGSHVALLRFLAGRALFDLHVGSTDPPAGGAAIPADAGSSIAGSERPRLVAAFNGGFKTDTYSGGFEVSGVVLRRLVAGDASLVIDANGRARVAVWGQQAPLPGEQVLSVRQNLPPLISAGRASTAVDVVSAWGATLYGKSYVARSALCSDAAGNLVYAASESAVPSDIADALLGAGCVTAMELDINPEWVQADVAASPGAALTAAVPGQSRPAAQYLEGWTRDFVAVLAAP